METSPKTSTVEVQQDTDDNFFIWLVKHLENYYDVFGWVAISIAALGILVNIVTVDVARRQRDQTSGTKWMIYLALWDTLFLSQGFLLIFGQEAFGVDYRSFGDFSCLLYRIFSNVSTLTASAHLVAMTVDRAVVITFTTWHCTQTWDPIIKRVSLGITGFYCAIHLPGVGTVKLHDGICIVSDTPALIVYKIIVVTLFFAVTHVVVVLVSTGLFIYKLRERRTPKPKPSKVTPPKEESKDSPPSKFSAKTPKNTEECKKFPGSRAEPPENTSAENTSSKERTAIVQDGLSDFIYMGPEIAPIPTPIRSQKCSDVTVKVEVHMPEAESESIKERFTKNTVVADASKPKEAFRPHEKPTKETEEHHEMKSANEGSSKQELGSATDANETSCDEITRTVDMGSNVTTHLEAEDCSQSGEEQITFCDFESESLSVKFSALGESKERQNITPDTDPRAAETQSPVKESNLEPSVSNSASAAGKHPRDETNIFQAEDSLDSTQEELESGNQLPGTSSEASENVDALGKEPQKSVDTRQDEFTEFIYMGPGIAPFPTPFRKQQVAESSVEFEVLTREATVDTAGVDTEPKKVLLQRQKAKEEPEEFHGIFPAKKGSAKQKAPNKTQAEHIPLFKKRGRWKNRFFSALSEQNNIKTDESVASLPWLFGPSAFLYKFSFVFKTLAQTRQDRTHQIFSYRRRNYMLRFLNILNEFVSCFRIFLLHKRFKHRSHIFHWINVWRIGWPLQNGPIFGQKIFSLSGSMGCGASCSRIQPSGNKAVA